MLRRLSLFLLIVATALCANLASAKAQGRTKTRVWAIDVAAQTFIQTREQLKEESRSENGCAYGEVALGNTLAAEGLEAAPTIARITPGSLPAAEEASVLRTLGHIDAGTAPTGSLATKWGTQFKNWAGDLPGAKGAASPYLEYRVAPLPGTSGAGPLRVVTNPQTGEMFYTWTHYGDTGAPAFVQIR